MGLSLNQLAAKAKIIQSTVYRAARGGDGRTSTFARLADALLNEGAPNPGASPQTPSRPANRRRGPMNWAHFTSLLILAIPMGIPIALMGIPIALIVASVLIDRAERRHED